MKKVDQAIGVIQYILKKKKAGIETLSKQSGLTEKERIRIGQDEELIQNTEVLITAFKKEIDITLGKIPPRDTSLEEAVIGAAILESLGPEIDIGGMKARGESPLAKVAKFLLPEHFGFDHHVIIYGALITMHKEKHPIDMRTVVRFLSKLGRLEEIGGAYYIAELCSRVSSAANIEYHARIIIEMAMRREAIRMANMVIAEAHDDTIDALGLVDRLESRIKEIAAWAKK